MSIEGLRFRVENGRCILQVLERKDIEYGYSRYNADWRDGKPEDLLELGQFLDRRRTVYSDGNCPSSPFTNIPEPT